MDVEQHNWVTGRVSRGLQFAEDALYAVVSLVLIAGAVILVIDAVIVFVTTVASGVQPAVLETLDRLLLIFILVELLGAVRAIIRSHELVAEPFLLVGMIASIKEIVVIAVRAKDDFGEGAVFDDAMTEIGVLGLLVIGLGLASYLLRRKEREPEEGAGG